MIQVHNAHIQQLIGNFSDLPLKDLELFLKELNSIVAKKRKNDLPKREKFLLRKINESVLPDDTLQRYIELQEKIETTVLVETEHQELLLLVEKDEKIRNKRFQYLIELSQIRSISLSELMQQLGLKVLHYA